MRRAWIATIVVLAMGVLAGCGLPAPGGPSAGKLSGPIKAGILAPLTGVNAAGGKDMVDGWNLYWKLNGTTVAGREIQTLVEDTAGEPNQALTRARQLVEQQQVDFLVGPLVATEGLAVGEFAKSNGIPLFTSIVAADELTQRARADNILRIGGFASSQPHHAFGEWAYEQGYRKIVTLCVDYAFGHEVCGGFLRTFAGVKGGQVVKQLWTPLGTADFGSYRTQIPGAGGDAVFAIEVGADAPRFVRQWSEFGLKGQVPLPVGEITTDQSQLRAMGPEAEGVLSAGHYAEGRPSKETQDFVEAYSKEFDRLPSQFSVNNYSAALWLAKTFEKLNGSISDRKAFLDGVRATEVDTPLGPLKLDAYNNPNQNAYIRKVERRPDGKLWNVPLKTYENVSQFWTFGPDIFLKQPSYSRTFQGLPDQLQALGIKSGS